MKLKLITSEQFKQAPNEDAAVRKEFTCEVKEAGDRQLEFTITTDSPDRDQDVIAADGWDTSNFQKNPVVLFGHDYRSLPVAKAVSLTHGSHGLKAVAEFATADLYPFADTVYRMLKGGFLRATSVGFRPLEYKFSEDDARKGGIDFTKQELLEFSVVPVPANAEALMGAKSAGIDVAPLRSWAKQVLLVDIKEAEVREQFERLIEETDKSVIPYHHTPLAAKDEAWDGSGEEAKASIEDLQVMCTWHADKAAGELTKGDFKLPHHRAGGDHACVWHGVANAAARLPGTNVPDADKDGIKSHLSKHYKDFGEEAPFKHASWVEYEKAVATNDVESARLLCAEIFGAKIAKSVFEPARDEIAALLAEIDELKAEGAACKTEIEALKTSSQKAELEVSDEDDEPTKDELVAIMKEVLAAHEMKTTGRLPEDF